MTTVNDVRELDIYDFDKTMIPFDSGSRFCIFCFLHYPKSMLYIPVIIVAALKYLFHHDLTVMKSSVFSFIQAIPAREAVKKFWDKNDKYVFDWAKKDNRERYSLMISASPDFLIDEIAKRVSIDDYICTVHDENGSIVGKNCHDREKVRLFREKYGNPRVINVYSDSLPNDKFIFSLGENCFHIVKGKRIPFKFDEMYKEDSASL